VTGNSLKPKSLGIQVKSKKINNQKQDKKMSYDDGYIDREEDLLRLTDKLRSEDVIAVDMESNGFFRYPESVCLIQIGFGGGQFLIDTVVMKNIDPLLAILADPDRVCVLHSCSYDVSSFKRDYECEFGELYDTAIAAAFLGLDRLGLDSVLKATIGVDIPKNKKLQRCDWTVRPLRSEQIAYAKSDVKFLRELREVQIKRLSELGRMEWVEEENEIAKSAAYNPPAPPETAFLKAKRVNTLSPRGKAVYKEVFLYRDEVALRRGRPPFMVFSNDLIKSIALHCETTGNPLDRSVKLPLPYIKGINAAVLRGLEAPPIDDIPPTRRRPRLDGKQMAFFKQLKRIRSELGERLNLDPALLWRMSHLEKLAGCASRKEAEAAIADGEPRGWQIQNFAAEFLRPFET